mmetsp:Transcript_21576/g.30223  ORF Transcript_21576/g.30223 Transcript_21576/m.30223 type:complete len:107 (-) Transcript_21576:388-708(-)
MGIALQLSRVKGEVIGRTYHPLKFSKETTEEPCGDDGAYGTSNETLPRFVGTYFEECFGYEFLATCHSACVGKGIIGYDEHDGEEEPEESIVNVVHNVLELPNCEC